MKESDQIIRIPELFTLILCELDARDQRKLMLVSKYLFYFVGPIAWKRLPRIDFLMRLIRGTIVDPLTVILPRFFKYKILITLPSNPDLSRYDIYAPWVRELEFFRERILVGIENTGGLLALLELNGRPLLPNLNRLIVYSIIPITDDSVHLVNMFMTSSLTDIRTILCEKEKDDVIRTFRIPWSSAPIFMKSISKKCPQIQNLEFYPLAEAGWGGIPRPRDQCRNALSSFLSLRSFSSTTYVLEPTTFGTLGELPHLESLSVRGLATENSILDKRLSIPETWFPSLKDLQLYEVHHEDIQTLWKQPTIVKKLTSVLVQIDRWPVKDSPANILRGQGWIGPFLASLLHFSPCLQKAVFYIGNGDSKVDIISQNLGSIGKGGLSPGDVRFMAS
ncbi:unnamed protein product [Rhizoctonia solani]|uniref:F-box domain-containing protein n=1 Tax=Rhizoctonia solani TaxID=456999 RepID=A0A8H3EDL6_9AGAM|nr:unnamed protein product [Rhizoctonia solani]